MPATFEDLKILKSAEEIADSIWNRVSRWDEFAKDVVGKQLARSADSIGANIAEAFGRYNFGEKIQFLYYSRGTRESASEYLVDDPEGFQDLLFPEDDLKALEV